MTGQGEADGWSKASPPPGGAPVPSAGGRLRWTRAFRIFGAYLLAAIVGVMTIPLASRIFGAIFGIDPIIAGYYDFAPAVTVVYVLGVVTSFLPMLAWVVVSERFRLRAFWQHVVAGGGVGAGASAGFMPVLTYLGPGNQPLDIFDLFVLEICFDTSVGGLAAGATYWRLAGRSAGDWRRAAPAVPAPVPPAAAPPGTA